MDREADVDHMPPSMFNTLSPGQSSPRLEASPLLFAVPPCPITRLPPPCTPSSSASSPISPLLLRHPSRPLTFYHHNRYIIPRSVFYSRVAPWNAFVRDIVHSPPLRRFRRPFSSSSSPLSLFLFSLFSVSFFFHRWLLDQRDYSLFSSDAVHFFTARLRW